jgi:hypothetical protein
MGLAAFVSVFVELTFQVADSSFKMCDAGFKFGDDLADDIDNGTTPT